MLHYDCWKSFYWNSSASKIFFGELPYILRYFLVCLML